MPRTKHPRQCDKLMQVARLYMDGADGPIDLDSLAKYAIAGGHYFVGDLEDIRLQKCKQAFSRAFREQYHRDAQGRHVRTWHAKVDKSRSEQHTFWGDMRTAPEEHMEVAFQQRRSQIVGDCAQLKTDVDSWNDNNTHGAQFQLIIDFTDDVAEREQPTQYQPPNPR
jgi:hypothetical protein